MKQTNEKPASRPRIGGVLLIALAGTLLGVCGPVFKAADPLDPATPGPDAQAAGAVASDQLEPPTLAVLQKEIQHAPYRTPESLTQFAHELAMRFKAATLSEDDAQTLFKDLRRCVLSNRKRTSPVTQALCLNTASHLAKIHSGLHPAYQKLLKRTSPEIVDLKATVGFKMM